MQLKSVLVTVGSRYVLTGINALFLIVSAKLLGPEEYGSAAIALTIYAITTAVTNFGWGPYLVQLRENYTQTLERVKAYAYCISILLAVTGFISLILILLAGKINLAILISIVFFTSGINTLNIIPKAELQKASHFTRLERINVVGGFMGLLIGLVGVYISRNASFILVKHLVEAGVVAYQFYLQKFYGGRKLLNISFKRSSFIDYQYGFNLLNFSVRNFDKVFLASFYSLTNIAFYDMSYRMMMLPVQTTGQAISSVFLPSLSSTKTEEKELYVIKTINLFLKIGVLISALFFGNSPFVVELILGEDWALTGVLLQILALSVALQIVNSMLGSIFHAADDSKGLFYSGLFSSVTSFFGLSLVYFVSGSVKSLAYLLDLTVVSSFLFASVQVSKRTFNKGSFWFLGKIVRLETLLIVTIVVVSNVLLPLIVFNSIVFLLIVLIFFKSRLIS